MRKSEQWKEPMEAATGQYQDIIDLPHHRSRKHPPMPVGDRAAQFAPFAALTGHTAAIRETGRWTDTKVELDEHVKVELDRKLQMIEEHMEEKPSIIVTYFQPDSQKEGGDYVTVTGVLRRIDKYRNCFVMEDGMEIDIDQIRELDIE